MTDEASSAPKLRRFPTRISGLDRVLNGGLFEGDTYMLMGQPGTGKTTLASHICFQHVFTGGRAVYVTMLAEEHSRLLAHLEGLDFYAPSVVGTGVAYYSAYDLLNKEGPSGLLALLRRILREHKANLLVLDGIATLQSVIKSDLSLKEFIAGLQVLSGVLRCTTLLLTSREAETYQPEYTMVDGILHLQYEVQELRASRTLTVRKLRGSSFLEGGHTFDISQAGFAVHPRTETLLGMPPAAPPMPSDVRLGFGVPGLDSMLHGGLFKGTATTLFGSTGSGKTSLGLHFLAEGVKQGERGFHLSFYESPPQIIAQAASLGLDLASSVEQGLIEIAWRPSTEFNIDVLAGQILTAVQQHDVRRLFIDGVTGLKVATAHTGRLSAFMAALHHALRAHGVTTLITLETTSIFGPELDVPLDGLSAIVDNIIFTRVVEVHSRVRRVCSILKLRCSDYDPIIREFFITHEGIKIAGAVEDREALLTGIARSPHSHSSKENNGTLRSVSDNE